MRFAEYRTVGGVAGPLVVVELVKNAKYAEIVNIRLGDGSTRRGQVRNRGFKESVIEMNNLNYS